MRQSRTSLASASVDRRTGPPKPMCQSFAGCEAEQASHEDWAVKRYLLIFPVASTTKGWTSPVTRHRGGTPVGWELCPPTSHPAGRRPNHYPVFGQARFQEGGPILENGAWCPWPASVATPSDRSGASHAYSVSFVIPHPVNPTRTAALLSDQTGFSTAPSGMTP